MSRSKRTQSAKSEVRGRVLFDSDQYNNQWVAVVSFRDNTVIASGKSPVEVLQIAKKKGHDRPVVQFVSDYTGI